MNWYYVNAGQSVGPLNQAEFDGLIRAGTIQPDTLVWREGMANWQPCRQMQQSSGAAAASLLPAGTAVEAVCAECGRIFPAESLIRIGGTAICANCKPLYVQKLREGVVRPGMPTAIEYGGFWIRLLAKILDSVILTGAAAVVIGFFSALLFPLLRSRDSPAMVGLVFLGIVVLLIVGLVIFPIWCLVKYGGTPGKRILRLRVVTATGGPIFWGRAFGRFFAEMLNGMIPLGIGYVIAAFDSEKRTIHDHIAGTRVIKD